MKLQSIILGIFGIVLVSLGSFWFLDNFELKEVDDYTGYQGEARSNQLFAARLFLKRMGIPSVRDDGLLALPADHTTVILLDTERYTFSAAKTDALLDWVKQGGHLITRARVDVDNADDAEAETLAQEGTEQRDWLQQRLEVTIDQHVMIEEAELPLKARPAQANADQDLMIDFFNVLKLSPQSPARLVRRFSYENQAWLLQLQYGAGLVTLASTLDFIQNNAIDQADHARFLWYLLHSQAEAPTEVWLVHQDTLPNLFTLLLRHAWPVLLVVLSLLIFIFWARAPRLGALIPEPPPPRRRLLEHIRASGQFLWKKQPQGPQQLVNSIRQALQPLLRQRIPGWQGLTPAQQAEQLSLYLYANTKQQAALAQVLHDPTLDTAALLRLTQLAYLLRTSS